MNLREFARGKWCQIRIPGVCENDRDTVVLCHVRKAVAGTGRKPSDLTAFWGCSKCHDVYDGRVKNNWRQELLDNFALEAIARTHEQYHHFGVTVKVPSK